MATQLSSSIFCTRPPVHYLFGPKIPPEVKLAIWCEASTHFPRGVPIDFPTTMATHILFLYIERVFGCPVKNQRGDWSCKNVANSTYFNKKCRMPPLKWSKMKPGAPIRVYIDSKSGDFSQSIRHFSIEAAFLYTLRPHKKVDSSAPNGHFWL